MSTNHTENYNLCQWEADDQVLRTEFNEDNAKLDAALAELQTGALRLYCGSYVGTGTDEFSFDIPFRPKFMLVQKTIAEDEKLIVIGDQSAMIVQALTGTPWCKYNGDSYTLTITDTTVSISTYFVNVINVDSVLNQQNVPYLVFLLG